MSAAKYINMWNFETWHFETCWSWQPWPALRGKRSSCCGSFSAREWTIAVIGGSQPWRGVVARKRGWEWVEAQTKSCRSIIRVTLLLTCSGRLICKKTIYIKLYMIIIFSGKALHTSVGTFNFAYNMYIYIFSYTYRTAKEHAFAHTSQWFVSFVSFASDSLSTRQFHQNSITLRKNLHRSLA